MSTVANRTLDLLLAGHEVGAVANPLGITPAAVEATAQDLTASPSPVNSTPIVNVLAPVTATALQDATGLPSEVYVPITLHAGGTVSVAIGPTNATATTIINGQDASLATTLNFRLPAGWFFKVTVAGSAAIAAGTVQVTG